LHSFLRLPHNIGISHNPRKPEVVAGNESPTTMLPHAAEGITRDLNFTANTLAAIYLGKVTRWNDAEIRNSNRGVHLQDAPIVVIHRSDGSGSTYAWSDFLSKTNPEWKDKIGMSTKVKWPTGQAAEGSEGVASEVEKTPNTIG
jgi:phosphate transport system substrate-binding protein